jgi:hypothetical protein
MMSRHHFFRIARAAASRSPAAAHEDCDAVCDAEQIVRHAWEAMLLDRAQRMDCAVQTALVNCDTADRLMTMAQRGGNRDEIDTARANLHEAADLARRSSAAAQCIRQALLPELDLLARTHEQHAHMASAGQAHRTGLAMHAQRREPTAAPAREPLSDAAPRRRARSWIRLIGRLARTRTARQRRL